MYACQYALGSGGVGAPFFCLRHSSRMRHSSSAAITFATRRSSSSAGVPRARCGFIRVRTDGHQRPLFPSAASCPREFPPRTFPGPKCSARLWPGPGRTGGTGLSAAAAVLTADVRTPQPPGRARRFAPGRSSRWSSHRVPPRQAIRASRARPGASWRQTRCGLRTLALLLRPRSARGGAGKHSAP